MEFYKLFELKKKYIYYTQIRLIFIIEDDFLNDLILCLYLNYKKNLSS